MLKGFTGPVKFPPVATPLCGHPQHRYGIGRLIGITLGD
jgi:hypothetical protein